MKSLSLPQAVASFLLITFCIFIIACGAGSNAGLVPSVVVAGTQNPLVAQVTIESACGGQAMVEFGPDTSYGRNTAWYPISGSYQQASVLVAGMKASTTYHMSAQVQCQDATFSSQDMTFKTGPLPSLPFPTLTVTRPSPSSSSPENPGIEAINVTTAGVPAYYTDRDGNPIWYYDVGQANDAFPFKLLPNGHILISLSNTNDDILREVDLAGNTIREMTSSALAQKVQAAGFDFIPNDFHHELLPLSNGHLIVLTSSFKNFTDLPGYPGTTEVIGDNLVDLDQNWNPVWAWNSFDYLDVNRHLNGLPDWTHSNALVYSPYDGNLLLSMRHQSWVLKIDYNNGAGTGNIIWHLGYQGDFALTQGGAPTDDPSEWFSFQHFPSLITQNGPQTTLAVWDNGDNRVLDGGGDICGVGGEPACYSRATVFQVDESAMVANLFWDTLPGPGDFAVWGGSINQLENGNIEFDINAASPPVGPNVASEVQEVTQTASPQVVWKMDISPITDDAYRAYRVPSLYPGVTWQY